MTTMTTESIAVAPVHAETTPTTTFPHGAIVLLGRALFAAIFVLAGALVVTQLGAGPWSLDARRG
jgi:hypothetical protein